MDRPEIVLDVGCVNPDCGHYGVKGLGNVVIRRRYGSSGIRFLHCRHCQHEFSERNGTPLYDLWISQEKIIAVVRHLAEGTGVRKTARLTGVSRDTVGRILKTVGKHARGIHDRLVRGLDVPEVQMDEMWSFVEKKRTRIALTKSDLKVRQVVYGTTSPMTLPANWWFPWFRGPTGIKKPVIDWWGTSPTEPAVSLPNWSPRTNMQPTKLPC